mgnify:CR=1 FL=1
MESTIYTVGGRDFELQHHGVKGMKWGVRRYQNKDGSLTQKGKKRSRLERAADAAQRDADNLRKHGYTAEADAVQKVADKNRQKAERQKQTSKRGAKADGKALQVAGTLYYTDLALTGGAVTRATAKAGKAAAKRTLNNIGDQMFDYSILDKDGKVLRRYN